MRNLECDLERQKFKGVEMLLMFIVYSNAVDEEMIEIIKSNSEGYTKFVGVQGEGHGEPHLGTHIWPSVNNCIMAAIDNKNGKSIAASTKELKDKFPDIGIKIFTTELKKII